MNFITKGVLSITMLALAGCVAPRQERSSLPPVEAAPSDIEADEPGEELREEDVPPAAPSPEVTSMGSIVEPPGLPEMRPRILRYNIAEMIGRTPEEIEGALGVPDEVSEEAPAITWRFAAGNCYLDFQFFQDLETGLYRALQYEVGGASEAGCLARLEHRARP